MGTVGREERPDDHLNEIAGLGPRDSCKIRHV